MPILSILTPTIRQRRDELELLCAEVDRQTHSLGSNAVEHKWIGDNRSCTVGEKRQNCLDIARGKFFAFVDDDDWISEDYVASIVDAILLNPEVAVVTFQQRATVNDRSGLVEFRLGNPNEAFRAPGLTMRNAWHVCAWRRELVEEAEAKFPASNYGEDWDFARSLCAHAMVKRLREVHIPRVLHFYRHSSETTAAPAPC